MDAGVPDVASQPPPTPPTPIFGASLLLIDLE